MGEVSKEWNRLLSKEIGNLLHLTSLEWDAKKSLCIQLHAKKAVFIEKVSIARMLMESVRGSILKESVEVQDLFADEQRRESLSSMAALEMQAGSIPTSFASPMGSMHCQSTMSDYEVLPASPGSKTHTLPILESNALLTKRVERKIMEGLHLKYKAQYCSLLGQFQIHSHAFNDCDRQRDSLEVEYVLL